MRLSALFGLFIAFIASDAFAQQPPTPSAEMSKEEYQDFINNHPFKTRPPLSPVEIKKMDKRDRPDLAWEQDFLRTMDPATGKPERQRLYQYMASVSGGASPGLAPGATASNVWTERGPNNIGGRTRALLWDPNTNNKVWAGGVTGGLWYNTDITSSSTSWTKVNDFWDNISVTAIAYDPNDNDTMYVGTGEGWGTASSIGGGIWKSTDGGSSWSLLSSTITGTSEMFYVNDLIVRNESGSSVIYAAVSQMYYNGVWHGDEGLFRSTNHGSTWTQVLPNISGAPYAPADIELDAGGRIWVGSRRNGFGNGGGAILRSDNGTTWAVSYTATGGRRVELATAPSDQSYLYALIEGISGTSSVLLEVKQSTNRGASWTTRNEPSDADLGIPATDFTRGQAWYDLILQVDPNDRRVVIAGGIDLFRSTNGTISWTQISKWSNNANLNTLSCPLVHADQHQVLFKPGSSDTAIIGNDGGVYFSDSLSFSATNSSAISSRNNGYNVTQFYSAALHPTSGNNHMLAGAQDNGTIRLNTAGVASGTEIRGGDGAFCFIDQTQPSYQIASYVRNAYYLSTNGGATFFTTQLIRDLTTGAFINPADYDDNQNVLYSARTTSTIQRVKSVTGTFSDDVLSVSIGSMASALKVSPHTTSSTTLFVGTDAGAVYKITGAQGSSASLSRIDPSSFPNGSVSCIQVGGSEDTLLVTFFNYGVSSVWYSTNGGTTWTDKDNTSLPDMPIRWALFNPYVQGEVILATEIGVWTCPDINAASPAWSRSNNGLANVRVDMLQSRSSDSTVMASTFGRGVFTSKFVGGSAPTASFTGTPTSVCVGDTVTFTDNSTGNPTSSQWTFTGGTPSSSSAGTALVVYNTPGSYTVRLISSNAVGSDTSTQVNYITVNANPTVSLSSFSAVCSNSGSFALSGGSPVGGTYSGTGVSGGNFNPSTAGVGSHTITYSFTNGSGCTSTATENIAVNASPTVSLSSFSSVCVNQAAFALTGGSPTGGSYSGTGVSTGQFDPSVAGIGTHSITYTVTNGSGCTDSASQNIVVSAAPTASLSPFSAVCTNNGSFTLTGGSPAGGAYSGVGVSGGSFDPSAAGAGTFAIKYLVSSGSCSDSATQNITVNASPSVALTAFSSVCVTNAPFSLTGGSPSGGTYTGPGVSGGTFTPVTAGIGNHTITYTFTNGSGCTDSATQILSVLSGSSPVAITAPDSMCTNEAAIALSAIPGGGSFSGTGVSGNSFNPSTAGAGVHVISYSVVTTCGSSNGSDTIVVSTAPSASLTSFSAVCEAAASFTITGGSPSGGTYLVNGSTASIFNPSSLGAGTHTISYVLSNSNGCSDTADQSIVVNPSPGASLSSISAQCVNASSLSLTGGTPSGGSYFGTGVSGASFDPSVAGVGTHLISYTVTNAFGCSDTASQSVVVNSAPTAALGTFTGVCSNDSSFTLSGGSPAGGSYSGTGVSSGVFNPTSAGVGTHLITYTVTNSNSCSASASQNITVSSSPTALLAGMSPFCVDATSVPLTGGSPSGGTYFGPGVLGSVFVPSLAGAGTHVISYTVSNSGCSDTASVNQIVYAVPNVNWPQVGPYCANDSAVALSGGTPLGGTYSGTGVSSNVFNPMSAGAGSHVLFYSVTDSNSCSANSSQNVTVNPLGGAALSSFGSICDNEAAFTITGGTPTGGSYLVNGVSATSFDPGATGTGIHTISYVFTTALGCTDTSSQLITVNASPTVSLASFANQCAGNSAFTLSGGNPSPGNYFINGVVGTNFNPGTLGAGTYTIKYDHVNGSSCRDSAFSTITVLAQPTVTLGPLADVCLNDSIVSLSGASPSGGSFSGNGVSGTSFDPAMAGVGTQVITYLFTDTSSCTDSAQQNLIVKPLPIIRALQDTGICIGDTASFTVGGGITYTWSPASSLDNPTSAAPKAFPTTTTRYFVTGTTLNSCSNFDSIAVVVNALPNVSAGSGQVICDGQITTLSASGASNYTWSPATGLSSTSSATPTVNVSSSISYTLIGTDTNSCIGSDSVRVDVNPKPTVNAGNDTAVCDGLPYTMMGSGANSYIWSPSTGLSDSTSATSSLSVSSSQMYTLIGSNTFGCSDTDAVMITALSSPTVAMSSIPSRCIDAGVFTLNQGSPSGGQYSGPGVSGSLMDPSSSGAGLHTITYNFTDTNGCSNSAFETAVVNALPVVRIDGLQSIYCENDGPDAFILTPLSGGTVSGSGIVGTSFVPRNVAVGDYVLSHSYTDTNGCFNSYSQNVKVAEIPEVPEIVGFRFVFKNTSYNYQVIPVNGASYTWKVSNGSLIASANNVASILWGTQKEGTITLIQNSVDGCSDSSQTTIHIGAVSVEEASIEDRLKVYPNPADDFLNVVYEHQGSEEVKMEVLEINGRLIWTSDIRDGGGKYEHQIDLRTYPAGTYMFRLIGAEEPYQKRFIRK